MPQYRKLYAKVVQGFDFNEMPNDFTRLAWVLLPTGADREGRYLDNTSFVKAKIMPLRDDVNGEQLGAALCWFAERGMILRYKVKGRAYFRIVNFHLYQGDTSRETPSVIPGPELADTDEAGQSGVTQEPVASKSSPYSICSIQYSTTPASEPPAAVVGVSVTEKEQEGAHETGRVFDAWQKLNPRRQATEIDGDTLNDMISEYGTNSVLKAIYIANEHGHPTLAYMGGILKNHGQPGARASPGPPAPIEYETRMITVFNPVTQRKENVPQLIPKQKPNN
jgi:hypothetical protein